MTGVHHVTGLGSLGPVMGSAGQACLYHCLPISHIQPQTHLYITIGLLVIYHIWPRMASQRKYLVDIGPYIGRYVDLYRNAAILLENSH